ncbi:MAG: hypothetical protein IPP40_06170 [bacterium]|nr:hypothetical protein [bacterium]
MEQAVDGSFIVISDEPLAPHLGQFGISKFSESGALISYRNIITGSEPHVTGFSKMPNNEFRLIGYFANHAFCMALSEGGDSLWTIIFPESDELASYSIVPMEDNGILTVLTDRTST